MASSAGLPEPEWLSDLKAEAEKKEKAYENQQSMLQESPRELIGLRIRIRSKAHAAKMLNAIVLDYDGVGSHQLRYPNNQILWVDLRQREFELEPVLSAADAARMLAEDAEGLVGMRLTLQNPVRPKPARQGIGALGRRSTRKSAGNGNGRGGSGAGGGGADSGGGNSASAGQGRRSTNRSRFTWIPGHVLDYDGKRHQLELENEQVVWLDLTRRKFRLLEEVLDSDDEVAAGESCEMEMRRLEPAELEDEGDSDAVHARLLQGSGAHEDDSAGEGAGSIGTSGDNGDASRSEPQTTVWSFGPFRFEFKAT